VTPDQLEKLLTRRESATVERKESARELPRSLETFAQPHKTNNFVIPAKAGIQYYQWFPGYRPSPA
jgi:hypothetical protein